MNSCRQGCSLRVHRSRFHDPRRYSNHHAYFQRPLVLIKSIPYNGQTDVSPDIKAIKLIFGKDFNNERGWGNAYNEIDMWQGSDEIPVRIRRGRDNIYEHRVILVIPIDPLLGGKVYKVRIKSFYMDRNGDRIKRIRLIVFTTRCR